MKVTFIMPCVGRKGNEPYVKTWQMEPLALAVLASLTPAAIERIFYDDRLEEIPYDEPTDLAAINVETYTAKRAYQIAGEFRKRGVPIVMGGFHATLMPGEVLEHADCVVIGAAEPVWEKVLADFQTGKMKKRYHGDSNGFSSILPDRSIYKDKKYMNITLIETGRGCRFFCEFCSITQFFSHRYTSRPVDDVIREIKTLKAKYLFFIDDNVAVDKGHTKKLLTALIPLKIKWVGQVSIDISNDPELLGLMIKSGCIGFLIGFESLNRDNLRSMNKKVNTQQKNFEKALKILKDFRPVIYATFIFGYDMDTEETFQNTLEFALKHKFFFTAFNHLVPFPGTPLYNRLEDEGRLVYKKWWLEDNYSFGEVAFQPRTMTPKKLATTCLKYRNKFYSPLSVIRRGLDFKVNCKNLFLAAVYWSLNLISGKDVARRQGLPLGLKEEK